MPLYVKKRYWRRCNNFGLFGESGYWQLGSQRRLQTSDPCKDELFGVRWKDEAGAGG